VDLSPGAQEDQPSPNLQTLSSASKLDSRRPNTWKNHLLKQFDTGKLQKETAFHPPLRNKATSKQYWMGTKSFQPVVAKLEEQHLFVYREDATGMFAAPWGRYPSAVPGTAAHHQPPQKKELIRVYRLIPLMRKGNQSKMCLL